MTTVKFVMFDLDNTVADTLHLKQLRDARNWAETYRQMETVNAFDGIVATWKSFETRGIGVGVVTHSPASYAKKVLQQIALSPTKLVAWHDLKGKRKPSPFGYSCCAGDCDPTHALAVGDELTDLQAADAFGCRAAFAGWSREAVLTAKDCEKNGWIFLANPADLIALVDDGWTNP